MVSYWFIKVIKGGPKTLTSSKNIDWGRKGLAPEFRPLMYLSLCNIVYKNRSILSTLIIISS